MLSCCYNTRTIGLLGFSAARFSAFLNFTYLLAYASSSFFSSLASSTSQPVIADKLQACTFWVTLSVGFFSLHVAPDLFMGDISTLPKVEQLSPRKPTTVKEEKKESDDEDFEAQVTKEIGKEDDSPQKRRGSQIETPRS